MAIALKQAKDYTVTRPTHIRQIPSASPVMALPTASRPDASDPDQLPMDAPDPHPFTMAQETEPVSGSMALARRIQTLGKLAPASREVWPEAGTSQRSPGQASLNEDDQRPAREPR
jgi:hypothetical protein